MKYGYARVSSSIQDLEAQLHTLKAEGCEVIYSEKFTGMSSDRKEFQKLLDVIKEGDTLTVTKMDRFARSAEDGVRLIREQLAKGVKVHVLNVGLIEDTAMGLLMLRMLSAIAEFDREMIVERLAEGKAIAKLKPDFKEGRPDKFDKKHMDNALKLLESNSYKQVESMTGISKSTLIRHKKKMMQKELV